MSSLSHILLKVLVHTPNERLTTITSTSEVNFRHKVGSSPVKVRGDGGEITLLSVYFTVRYDNASLTAFVEK